MAIVSREDEEAERWLWTNNALKRPKGWRKRAGYRASWLETRGAADEYWNRWLAAAALRPDLQALAQASLKADRSTPKKPARKRAVRKRGNSLT
ncbi:MAG: hypothetical protein K0R61_528 [Microvirga sp.]|nr:hypothetical protein [Rhodospirillales bacterium]MDF2970078.1 hypothetical protein [Microvirga sp.]